MAKSDRFIYFLADRIQSIYYKVQLLWNVNVPDEGCKIRRKFKDRMAVKLILPADPQT